MHYKGYEAVIEFDEEAEIFHGEVVNMRDVITFQGTSAAELKQAFADSLDDYLAFCAERGEQPEKPFSGQFVVRADPTLHKALSSAAQRDGVSLNKWVTSALERAVG
ncbi:antitoxin HicB [Rhizobium leguminosarum]|uniref:Toxin-antitoxin system HicB family antitoxin n=3 Tax=Rhizobium/Agrobacterium group TaxID=227290 RepID=A0A6N9ZIM3_9HYPH|nr:antitoxin HicB [Rhizobium leguminosarum]MBY3196408.1 type II toxin-antitoxin system HicB family antitoxin [Rhizobium laguerreae]NKM05101.1 toxin-antitoxin system HicB family antitoxin [Rhizobium leguminosarum bv. viciae]MBY3228369.1 type II toxin-antitoxin system HicB family antitoxin [Rhizobium laguerreae]MBY3562095.1 type II toxin-antitoxin system HicB family antitoxin [Rhizobium laguerreae]